MPENPFIQSDPDEGSPAWMVTYSDMTTLLLVFFILLFSFSKIDALRFKNAIKSVQGALGVLKETTGMLQKGETPMNKILNGSRNLEEMNDFFKKFQVYVKENNLQNVADLNFTEQGIVIAVTDMLIFKPGSADLSMQARQAITRVLPLIQMFPYEVSVVGHADTTAIKSPRYPSNWELSLARAMVVKKFLTSQDDRLEQRTAVTAYGSNRPLVVGNEEVRPDLSRRVDIILHKPTID